MIQVGGAADVRAFYGGLETGKSHEMKRQLAQLRPPRLIVFDPNGEYESFGAPFDRLPAVVARSAASSWSIVFRPNDDLDIARRQFNALCGLVFARGHCWFVIDELADVSNPRTPPRAWVKLLRKLRHRYVKIMAASQRPADVDPHIFSFATVIRTGRLNREEDVQRLANALMLRPADLIGLQGYEFIERNMKTGAYRGKYRPTGRP